MLRELTPPDLSSDQSPDDWKRVCFSVFSLLLPFYSIISFCMITLTLFVIARPSLQRSINMQASHRMMPRFPS